MAERRRDAALSLQRVTIRVRLAPTRGCAVLATLACITLTGVADGGTVDPATRASQETDVVVIEQMRFNPPDLIVHRGDRVVWVNKDLFPHTATATSTAFDSRSIAPDASWPYLANRPGRYPYACTFHPTMRGTLTVRIASVRDGPKSTPFESLRTRDLLSAPAEA